MMGLKFTTELLTHIFTLDKHNNRGREEWCQFQFTPLVPRLMTHDGDQVRVLTSSYPGLTLTMAITGQPPGWGNTGVRCGAWGPLEPRASAISLCPVYSVHVTVHVTVQHNPHIPCIHSWSIQSSDKQKYSLGQWASCWLAKNTHHTDI